MLDLSYLKTEDSPLRYPTFVGLAMVGSSAAVVGYSLCNFQGHRKIEDHPYNLEPYYYPQVWLAYQVEKTHPSSAIQAAVEVASSGYESRIVIEGTVGTRSLLRRELDQVCRDRFRVVEFVKSPGRFYGLEEVVSGVLEDIRTGRISSHPAFEDHPDRTDLMRQLGAIDVRGGSGLSALQRAFLYGVGYWSCAVERPKYKVGRSRRSTY